jgi:molybdopterin converting factor small subunit
MMVDIHIPTSLRPYARGARTIRGRGATLGELLNDLEERHAGLRASLVDSDGDLRRGVLVFIDDRNARELGALRAPIGRAATVTILPAVAGGAFGLAALAALATARRREAVSAQPRGLMVPAGPGGGEASWNPSSC